MQTFDKRQVDFQIITDWVTDGARVLDLGCGRGILLEHLKQTKNAWCVGVDVDPDKILSCVKRGISAYQGDIEGILNQFDDHYFDWVILSRTVQELSQPKVILREALRVGKQVAVGFANYDYWVSKRGQGGNLLFEKPWHEANPIVPVSLSDFEAFCTSEAATIEDKVFFCKDSSPTEALDEVAYALYAVSG